MNLTQFLLARIAADEKWAQARIAEAPDWRDPAKCLGGLPAHVLADCEAKRRIVELEQQKQEEANRFPFGSGAADLRHGAAYGLRQAMKSLALSYADHADYREEWKP